jgi:hypothetical protein
MVADEDARARRVLGVIAEREFSLRVSRNLSARFRARFLNNDAP